MRDEMREDKLQYSFLHVFKDQENDIVSPRIVTEEKNKDNPNQVKHYLTYKKKIDKLEKRMKSKFKNENKSHDTYFMTIQHFFDFEDDDDNIEQNSKLLGSSRFVDSKSPLNFFKRDLFESKMSIIPLEWIVDIKTMEIMLEEDKPTKFHLCPICNKQFKNGTSLGGHIGKKHKNQKVKYSEKLKMKDESYEKKKRALFFDYLRNKDKKEN